MSAPHFHWTNENPSGSNLARSLSARQPGPDGSGLLKAPQFTQDGDPRSFEMPSYRSILPALRIFFNATFLIRLLAVPCHLRVHIRYSRGKYHICQPHKGERTRTRSLQEKPVLWVQESHRGWVGMTRSTIIVFRPEPMIETHDFSRCFAVQKRNHITPSVRPSPQSLRQMRTSLFCTTSAPSLCNAQFSVVAGAAP
jgi:hypothetical protein